MRWGWFWGEGGERERKREREREREPDSRVFELVSTVCVIVTVSGWPLAFELGWGSSILESSEGRRDGGGVKKASGGEERGRGGREGWREGRGGVAGTVGSGALHRGTRPPPHLCTQSPSTRTTILPEGASERDGWREGEEFCMGDGVQV